MTILSRFLRRGEPEVSRPSSARLPWPPPQQVHKPSRRPPGALYLQARGVFRVVAGGEARYQAVLERICGASGKGGVEVYVDAHLIVQQGADGAPVVAVEIEGHTVGYLPAHEARALCAAFPESITAAQAIYCPAVIMGGWERPGGNRSPYGVRLDLPTPPTA